MHLRCISLCPVVFRLSPDNSHNATEGKKLIESIYFKNNTCLLTGGVYEDNKNLALAKVHRSYDKQLYKQRNNIERYFLRLKRFRKVFTRYYNLDSIFIFTISLAFIFYLLFMWTLPKSMICSLFYFFLLPLFSFSHFTKLFFYCLLFLFCVDVL